jgi:hypothetical protein
MTPRFSLALCAALGLMLFGCRGLAADTPTAADIDKAMHTLLDKPASAMTGRTVVTVNSAKIGKGAKATDMDVFDGIPEGTWVTAALIDYTVREYGGKSVHAVRRVRYSKVYKDEFNEWRVMTGQPKGADEMSDEPLPAK